MVISCSLYIFNGCIEFNVDLIFFTFSKGVDLNVKTQDLESIRVSFYKADMSLRFVHLTQAGA